MKIAIFFVGAVLVSLNAVAAQKCKNLSGHYLLSGISSNNALTIEQKDCSEVKFTSKFLGFHNSNYFLGGYPKTEIRNEQLNPISYGNYPTQSWTTIVTSQVRLQDGALIYESTSLRRTTGDVFSLYYNSYYKTQVIIEQPQNQNFLIIKTSVNRDNEAFIALKVGDAQ